jgi:CBS domain-containing protein
MTIEKRTSELLPELFEVDPPSIQGDDPIVLTGSLIKHNEVHLLPAGKKVSPRRFELAGVTLHGAFGGYGILKRIARSQPKDYYKTLWARSAEVPIWIGSCKFGDPFDDILQAYSLTRFGGARVTKGGSEALVTLGDALGLIGSGKLSTHMTTDDVCSVPIAIAEEVAIIDAIRMMISNNIRRLFVRGGKGKFISDRTLIDFMFSPARLEIARDDPEKWLDGGVAKLATKTPGRCRTGDLDEASKAMGQAPDDCLLTDESRVISRWDIVVKPWRARKLATLEN